MKTKLVASFLTATVLGALAFAQPRTDAQTAGSLDTASPTPSSYLVTTPVCLQDSSGQTQRIFVSADIVVGQLDTNKCKLILSSSPDSNAPFIVDDAVFINGQRFNGYAGAESPYDHLGENPDVCYQGMVAVDVTDCLRRDGHVHVQCMDIGGGVFGCSALYLRVVSK